jgi:hypothetical protein
MKPCANKYCETLHLCQTAPIKDCLQYIPVRTYKSFGWEVTVRFQPASNKPDQMFHYRGCTEGMARRRGMLKKNADSIFSVTPVTEEEWKRAYGIGRM